MVINIKLSIQKRGIIYISLILSAGIFLADLFIPLGVAAGVPYMTVVLLSLWHPSKNYTIGVAILSSLLIVIGYFLSPEGGVFWMIIYNRILALAVIWVTAIFTVERKKGELALQENEQGLKRAMQIAKLGHWEWNILSDKAVLSDEYCEIFKIDKDKSFKTDDYMKLLHPDDRKKQQSIIEKSINEKKGLSSHYRIVLDGNVIKHIHSEWEIYTDSENNPIKMAGTVQDITEQKKVLDDLTVSELNLNKAQEMAHVGSWDLDLFTNKLYWSDEVYRIFGLTPQEFGATYEAFVEAIHPDDREMVNKAYQSAVKNNVPYEVIHRVLRPNGEVRIVREMSEEILDLSGKAIRSVGTVHDITELHETTQILKNERNHFDKLLESIGEVVFIINLPERLIERVNKQVMNVLGYEDSECIGQSTRMFYKNEKDFQQFGSLLQEAIKRGDEVVHIDQILIKKDGSPFPSDITASFVTKDDVITHVISVIRDVSERVQTEKKLRESKDKLEERVAERTLDLQKSLREKEVLLKEIHHRVKNNLQIISSLLNLQANEIKDKKIIKNLMDMRSRVLSMSLIHENIYRSDDLSKVDVNNYVAMLTENLIQTYSEDGKNVKIINKVGDITLDIDKAIPLGLIITELVTNAMQHAFIKKKKGTININLNAKNNDILEMKISDNGDGMAKDTGINGKGNLGFMLVKTLSDQLDAELEMKVSNGTKYTMSFKK